MSRSRGEEIKNRIKDLLRDHPEGLTLKDIAAMLKVSKVTATKYVLVLEAVGDIARRRLGSATLHYLIEGVSPERKEIIEKIKRSIMEGGK